MNPEIKSKCIKCGNLIPGAFPHTCPHCGFNIDQLAGKQTNSFQSTKWNEHTDLIQARGIQLYGKDYNASFDFNGMAKIEDLVRFTLSFGDSVQLSSRSGRYQNLHIFSYVPEIVGSGTSVFQVGDVPCSGVSLVSADSAEHGHTYPFIDDWIRTKFADESSNCRFCGKQTSFAQPVCSDCYRSMNWDWTTYL